MNLSTKVAYNTIVQVLSKVISTALGLVAVGMITRYLGQSGFGQYTTVITFISFFAILADLGLTLVTVQMISNPANNQKKVLNNLLSLRLVSALIFLGLAPIVVIFLPYDPIVKFGIAVTTISFLFAALNQIMVGLFQKELRMDKVSISEVVSRLALVIGVVLAVKLDYGLIGVLWMNILASLVNFLLHYIFSRQFALIKLEFDFKIWKDIIKKSWPLAITITFNLIYLKADTLILSLVKSQAEVGIYGAAYKVIEVLTTIPFMFAGIVLPILTASWIANNKEYFKQVLQKSFDFMVIVAVPMFIGTQFVANEIMALVGGSEFAISGVVLKILIGAASLIFLGGMFSHAIIALDKQKKIIGAYVFVSITALVGYLIFIPKYSYFGAAWMTIYSEAAIALASFYYVWKYSRFVPQFKIFIKSILASLVMGVGLYYLPNSFYSTKLGLSLTLIFSCLVYSVFLYLFKGISRDDLKSLMNKS